jgi:hypothetical protein
LISSLRTADLLTDLGNPKDYNGESTIFAAEP